MHGSLTVVYYVLKLSLCFVLNLITVFVTTCSHPLMFSPQFHVVDRNFTLLTADKIYVPSFLHSSDEEFVSNTQ